MCGVCASGTGSLLDDAPQLTAANRPESVSYTDLKCVSIERGVLVMGKEGRKKETPIAHRGTEGLTEKLFVEG